MNFGSFFVGFIPQMVVWSSVFFHLCSCCFGLDDVELNLRLVQVETWWKFLHMVMSTMNKEDVRFNSDLNSGHYNVVYYLLTTFSFALNSGRDEFALIPEAPFSNPIMLLLELEMQMEV